MKSRECVLLVDDDVDTLDLLTRALQREGYAVDTAEGGADALRMAKRRGYDLILSDVTMARGDGISMVSELRRSCVHDGPVILMSGEHWTGRRVRALDEGADDFLPKPVDVAELLARLRAHLRRAQRYAEVKHSSLSDSLTGVLNRAGIVDRFAHHIALLGRRPGALSVVVIDLDDFKRINDRHGHLAGDAAIVAVSRVLAQSVRASDAVGRWGGDEFLVLAPETDASTADVLCSRLRSLCPIAVDIGGGLTKAVSFSVGAATATAPQTLEALLKRADVAMYAEKRRRKASGEHQKVDSTPSRA